MPAHRRRTVRVRGSFAGAVAGVVALLLCVYVVHAIVGRESRHTMTGAPMPGSLRGWSPASPRSYDEPTRRSPTPHQQPPDPRLRPGHEAPKRWVRVLRRLDERREQAWRKGSPEGLTRVFEDGAALRQDTEALRGYLRRGLTVDGVAMSYHRVRLVGRSALSVRLRVVDRLGPATVHRGHGSARRLPRDRPSSHLITLTATDGAWRIAHIRDPSG